MEQVVQQLGNYRLIRLLGQGAFADVYLGEHQYLNTLAAIKILRSQVDGSTIANFLAEARHVSHLAHTHIIRVFDFGLEAYAPFLVMDYAPFGNLRFLHPRGTIVPLPTIAAYVKALASGLQHAHDQGIVHRDLKPENVLLGPQHEVLLSDFGLAFLTSETAPSLIHERLGTATYMAPEQVFGQPSPASDQYALAVVAYEWLCGRFPFEGSAEPLASQHVRALPPSLHAENPALPLLVEQVVFAGLAREPALRFADILSFARAFEDAVYAVPAPYMLSTPTTPPLPGPGSVQFGPLVHFENVPLPLTPLIGCEQELQAARDLLLHPAVRLVTLTGAGGIGKTHLALALGVELLEAFSNGVCFVSLDSVASPDLVALTIAHALELPALEALSSLDQMKTLLHDKQLLLLLDSFEQVLPTVPMLSDLLSFCPQLKLLVTSHSLLHVWGEYEFTVPPLEVPDLDHLPGCEALSRVGSIALFVQRAQAVLNGFQLTDENALDIARICVRLEGVPLALELSAARSKLLPPHSLLARLESGWQVLSSGRLDAPLRQQTLRNSLTCDYDLLSPDEQLLFQRLAVFAGGCSLEGAEAISTALGGMTISALDGVASLIDKSLVRRLTSADHELRLYPFEMLRGYALERLAAGGEMERMRDAHADYYLALADKAELTLHASPREPCLKRLEREHENLQRALLWLLESRRIVDALRLIVSLELFWLSEGHQNEGYDFLKQALETSSECAVLVPSQLRARALSLADSLVSNHADPTSNLATEDLDCDPASRQLPDRHHLTLINSSQLDVLSVRPPVTLFPLAREELTPREVEVLLLLARGLSNNQIAAHLVLSPHTVNVHNQSIFGKLGVNSRSGATRYAFEHQLV